MRILRGVLVAVGAALAVAQAAGDSNAASECVTACRALYDDTLRGLCGSCADTRLADRDACRSGVQDDFSSCIDDIAGNPGRCALTRDLVARCRTQQATGAEQCQSKLRFRIRKQCAGGRVCLAAARKARRGCLKSCRRGGRSVATTPAANPAAGACQCQQSCIETIVGSCYQDCNDACEGDQVALGICRGACRDAQCAQLENQCTVGQDGGGNQYQRCCTACGNCETEVDCVTTTSTTTTSSTSSTTTTVGSSTTTTTLRSF